MATLKFNEAQFTFSEALAASGADNAWLRTFIARDKAGLLGTKHRTGRLLFSLKDIAAIAVLFHLNARLRIAPAAAWEIIDAMSEIIEESEDAAAEVIHLSADSAGLIFIWTVDEDGVVTTFGEHASSNMAEVYASSLSPHVVIPMRAILGPIAVATKLAMDWPE